MIEQKGTGALHGVKLASVILLLYSLHWLLAACSAARSVVVLLPATNVEPTSQPTTPPSNLTIFSLEHIASSMPQYISPRQLQQIFLCCPAQDIRP
jgi:hypothetical protein